MIEPIQMTTALIASGSLPIVFVRVLRVQPFLAWLGSVALANVLTQIIFSALKPDFHYGPLFGLGIVMYAIIISVVAAFMVIMVQIRR
jgi:hypothetical protein